LCDAVFFSFFIQSGGGMEKKKMRSVSFDTMIKFFMQNYNIPTKKDIDKLISRLERMEEQLQFIGSGKKSASKKPDSVRKTVLTASDMVLDAIKNAGENGAGFAEIKEKTGFENKKLRNIIYRMDKVGKIKRKARGVYVISK
jgi:uncharacterized protein (UPF0335 family)